MPANGDVVLLIVALLTVGALVGPALSELLRRTRRRSRAADAAVGVLALAGLGAAAWLAFPRLSLDLPPLPLGALFTLTALNLALGESFPFSPFPMYSSFGARADYVRVTDENDELVPLLTAYGLRPTLVRKKLQSEIRARHGTGPGSLSDEELAEPAGVVLDWIAAAGEHAGGAPAYRALKLYFVEIYEEQGRVCQRERFLGRRAL